MLCIFPILGKALSIKVFMRVRLPVLRNFTKVTTTIYSNASSDGGWNNDLAKS